MTEELDLTCAYCGNEPNLGDGLVTVYDNREWICPICSRHNFREEGIPTHRRHDGK